METSEDLFGTSKERYSRAERLYINSRVTELSLAFESQLALSFHVSLLPSWTKLL